MTGEAAREARELLAGELEAFELPFPAQAVRAAPWGMLTGATKASLNAIERALSTRREGAPERIDNLRAALLRLASIDGRDSGDTFKELCRRIDIAADALDADDRAALESNAP